MKSLYITRHAKSSWKDAGLSDEDRPLNARGKHDAPAMGKRLRKLGVEPEIIFSSPATRAVTTATLLAEKLHFPSEEIVTEDDIYEAGTSELLTVLRRIDDRFTNVMLIGHNPGLTMLANRLSPARIDNIPTCGVVGLKLHIDSWNALADQCGEVSFFISPKIADNH